MSTSLQHLMAPLAPLLEPAGITEVVVNRPAEAYVESATGWTRHELPTLDLAWCRSLARAMSTWARTGRDLKAESPLLSITLPAGERVQLVIPPACTPDTVSITIRKPPDVVRRLEDFERGGLFRHVTARQGELQEHEQALLECLAARRWRAFFQLAVKHRLTLVVSGQTGCGKTTFLKGLVEEIDTAERLITIESTAEMATPCHPNSVHLFWTDAGAAAVTPEQLLQASLRMRPDRILLAEVRGEEALYFVRAAASGHPGSMTSLHAGSAAQAFEQLALMIRQSKAGAGLDLADIRRLLMLTVDAVVQFGNDPAKGRHISEVHYDPQARLRLAQGEGA